MIYLLILKFVSVAGCLGYDVLVDSLSNPRLVIEFQLLVV